MPPLARDSLLELEWIWAIEQHHPVVIRFKNERVAGAQTVPDDIRWVAEVGCDANLQTVRFDNVANWIHSVMRNRKRRELKVVDPEGLPNVGRDNLLSRDATKLSVSMFM